jgi:hypothetical protein
MANNASDNGTNSSGKFSDVGLASKQFRQIYRFETQRLQLHAVKIGILADTAASSTMPAGTGNARDSHTMLQHSFDVNTRSR